MASSVTDRENSSRTDHRGFRRRLDNVKATARVTGRFGADVEKAETHRGLRRIVDLGLAGEKLAMAYRKEIKNGNFSVFIPALALAIFKDMVFDPLTLAFFLGEIFGIPIAVFLFIFLWGKGKWKVRLVVFILSFLDLIPAANLLPMSTLCVLYAYHYCKKRAKEAEEKLTELNASMSN